MAESPLDSWVSVDASGNPVATVNPTLTTIDGVATIINANPGATTSITGDSKPTSTLSGAVATSTGGGSFPLCHNKDGDFAPFCLPNNASSVYVGETYYVTWDINYFSEKNATVLVMANYVNASNGGPQAFESPISADYRGFYAWTINKSLLQGHSWNNVTLFLLHANPSDDEPRSFTGPNVMVTNRPTTYYRQPKTPAPEGKTLYIALPTVLGAIFLLVCGTHLWNRHNRRIGLGNVMGRRKGYGHGKSKAQRMGLQKNDKASVIQLREQELTADGQYQDLPENRDTMR
ncbi:hypothetical protein D0Z07_0908 [Hyphodiscus hymeniophilus]|uniref:Uncharacterized protein n=1 Tax=Hyphodiscus hymeniophilus TaxID=353542 RepID=A0A9P7B0A9_9HELO|nr:hypothetical protein D0Z07_0908 [Hyphodiscus hymeniophilus]